MKKMIYVTVCIVFLLGSINAQPENKPGKKQFIYLLRLEKSMYDSSAWTPEKKEIVGEHFARLQKMLGEGTLILAGRTLVDFERTLGIIIYEADSFEQAKKIAEEDPAVKAGIMNVEVYPYKVVLMQGVKPE